MGINKMILIEAFNFNYDGDYIYSECFDEVLSQVKTPVYLCGDPELLDIIKGLITIKYDPNLFMFTSAKRENGLGLARYIRVSSIGS